VKAARRHDFQSRSKFKTSAKQVLPNVGIITLEDAETGEQIEINTADRTNARARF